MNTVTLSVASREDVTRRTLAAFEGQTQGAHISFGSAELLRAVTGRGVMSFVRPRVALVGT